MSALKWLIAIVTVVIGVSMCTKHGDANDLATKQAAPSSSPLVVPASKTKSSSDALTTLVGNIISHEYLKFMAGNEDLSPRFSKNFGRPIIASTEELHRISASNIAAADREYGGKRLLIHARVLDIHAGRRKSEYIVSVPGGFAIFHDDDGFVATLVPGQDSQFICTYEPSLASHGYGLDGCRSKSSVADQVAMMIITAPTMIGDDGAKALENMKSHVKLSEIPADSPCLMSVNVKACFGEDVEEQIDNEGVRRLKEALQALPASSSVGLGISAPEEPTQEQSR